MGVVIREVTGTLLNMVLLGSGRLEDVEGVGSKVTKVEKKIVTNYFSFCQQANDLPAVVDINGCTSMEKIKQSNICE